MLAHKKAGEKIGYLLYELARTKELAGPRWHTVKIDADQEEFGNLSEPLSNLRR